VLTSKLSRQPNHKSLLGKDIPLIYTNSTPGRLRDLVCERRALDLSKLRFFVLDESDQMIDDLKMR
jgi:hypothetical protein